MTTIGVISDTHNLLRPEAKERLVGSDLILHAGDIGSQVIITELQQIAPVIAIRGNIDNGAWAEDYPHTDTIEIGSQTLYLLHNLHVLTFNPQTAGVTVVISGHSHKPTIERKEGVFYLNPGSAGPRRFKLPIALAKLTIQGDAISAEIIEIPPTS